VFFSVLKNIVFTGQEKQNTEDLVKNQCFFDSIKEGGGFVHKSALLKNVVRTFAITHILIDLDELNIFCSMIGYPQRFLKKFYHSLSAVLFHTRG
jgi:hypothetical protein